MIEGLKVHSPSSEHLPELSRRVSEQADLNENIEYVDRLPNESVEFEYVENSKSNNALVNAIANDHSYVRYLGTSLVCQAWQSALETLIKRKPEYPLHHQ